MPTDLLGWGLVLGATLSLCYLTLFCWRGDSWLKTGVKTGAVALPAIGLISLQMPLLPLAGLWACVLGDFLLSRPGDRALRAGIAAFALGHVLYVVAFWLQFSPSLFADQLALVLPLLLVLLGLTTERWLMPRTGDLRPAVRIYVLLILLMGCLAAQQPIPRDTILLGALAFILSDLLLSLQLFVTNRGLFGRLAPFAVWFFYYAAQVLIIAGFIL